MVFQAEAPALPAVLLGGPSSLVALVVDARYHNVMVKAKAPVLEKPIRVPDEEDQATLAAIDQGIADAKSGRTVPLEKVRELLPKWISASSSRKER